MPKRNPRHIVTWREYERAMFNDLYYRYRAPAWRVQPDLRTLRGLISREHRQVDVAVFASGGARPEIAVECKLYGRRLNVKDVEGILGMLEDVGAKWGVLVAPLGFSRAAERRVQNTSLVLLQLGEREARRLNWRELARAVFPWDEGFHPDMGNAFHALVVDNDVDQCIEALEELPFEEWDNAVRTLCQAKPTAAASMLHAIAEFHPEDDWRYNAVRLLDELGILTEELIDQLLEQETDATTRELLHELRGGGAGT